MRIAQDFLGNCNVHGDVVLTASIRIKAIRLKGDAKLVTSLDFREIWCPRLLAEVFRVERPTEHKFEYHGIGARVYRDEPLVKNLTRFGLQAVGQKTGEPRT